MSSNRIVRHDNAVCENWKALENGNVKLPDFFEDHIKKFVSRRKAGNLSSPGWCCHFFFPTSIDRPVNQ